MLMNIFNNLLMYNIYIKLRLYHDFVFSKCLHYYSLLLTSVFFPQLCVILCVKTVEPALHLTCVNVQQTGQMPHVKHVMKLILIYYGKWGKSKPIHIVYS